MVWFGQTKRFVEQRGATEPSQADAFSQWHCGVVKAKAAFT